MKRLFVVAALVVGTLALAIPPMEAGLKSDNDSRTIPRTLEVTDGGSVCNVDLAAGGPRNPNPFNIPGTAALFVQCPDAGAWVYTDVTTTAPGLGVMVHAGGAYSTACFREKSLTQIDAGTYKGCVIAIAPLAGAATASCIVHVTKGL